MAAAAVLAALSPLGCGEGRPCGKCAPIEGRYALAYEVADGGECRSLGASQPPSELEISRFGSTVRTQVDGVELTGTLYDLGNFSLGATGAPDGGWDSLFLRGYYLPPSASADAGARIRGTYSASYRRPRPAGDERCLVESNFLGAKH